jgi:hypothetical protein
MANPATREDEKAERERTVFLAFLHQSRLPINASSVESRRPPEADIYCVHNDDGPVAFELAELCDSDIAGLTSRLLKSGGGAGSLWTSDPTSGIFLNKLRKTYQPGRPVELIVYTNARVVTTDDQIVLKLEDLICSHGRGPFQRVWLLGEKICQEIL